jgi:LDH2 family malate/lactate/ureidoglycolate dehydrogenase
MMELLAGVMSGAAFGGQVRNQNADFSAPQDVGHTFIAFKPDLFLSAEAYRERAAALVQRAKACTLADGFDDISMPGEREEAMARRARLEGLAVSEQDMEMLREEEQLASGSAAERSGSHSAARTA